VELTVPVELAEVEGSCPACGQTILAPKRAVEEPSVDSKAGAGGNAVDSGFSTEGWIQEGGREEKSFTAKRAIDPAQASLGRDDSWKERHRERARNFRKREKWEKFFGRLVSVRMGFAIALIFSLVMGYVAYKHHREQRAATQQKQEAREQVPPAGVVERDAPSAVVTPTSGGRSSEDAADEKTELFRVFDDLPASIALSGVED
jgi:hypothetical protein